MQSKQNQMVKKSNTITTNVQSQRCNSIIGKLYCKQLQTKFKVQLTAKTLMYYIRLTVEVKISSTYGSENFLSYETKTFKKQWFPCT